MEQSVIPVFSRETHRKHSFFVDFKFFLCGLCTYVFQFQAGRWKNFTVDVIAGLESKFDLKSRFDYLKSF